MLLNSRGVLTMAKSVKAEEKVLVEDSVKTNNGYIVATKTPLGSKPTKFIAACQNETDWLLSTSNKKAHIFETTRDAFECVLTCGKLFTEELQVFRLDSKGGLDDNLALVGWKANKSYSKFLCETLKVESLSDVDYSNHENLITALEEAYMGILKFTQFHRKSYGSDISTIDKRLSEISHVMEGGDVLDKDTVYDLYMVERNLRQERRSLKQGKGIADLLNTHIDLEGFGCLITYLSRFKDWEANHDSLEDILKQGTDLYEKEKL